MKFLKGLFLALLIPVFIGGFMLISEDAKADKVYSSGGTTTTQTYVARGFVSRVQNPGYYDITAMGMTDGVVYRVYGENADVDASADDDIWDGGMGGYDYTADAAADAVSFSSSSASDTSADTVTIVGLNVTGDLTTQTINANGTTRVALTTALWRVLSMSWNGATANVGNIAVYTGTSTIPSQGDSKIRGWIGAGLNRTSMGIFTCPNDTVCFVKSAEVGFSREGDTNTEIDLNMYVKRYGLPYYSVKPKINMGGTGLVKYKYDFTFPLPLPGKTDLRFHVDAVDASTDNLGVYDYIEILSISEDYFDSTFLTNIGQP